MNYKTIVTVAVAVVGMICIKAGAEEKIKYSPFDDAMVTKTTVLSASPSKKEMTVKTIHAEKRQKPIIPMTSPLKFNDVSVKFSREKHEEAIKEAVPNVTGTCSDNLINAQTNQDVLHPFDATVHFDNCRLQDSVRRIMAIENDVKEGVKKGEYAMAAFEMGKAMHTIQDFFSHSNFVELAAGRYPKLQDVPVPQLWTADGLASMEKAWAHPLKSGRVWYEKGDNCSGTDETHSVLNKDKESGKGKQTIAAWNVTYHQAALELAKKATAGYIAYLNERYPNLLAGCNSLTYTAEFVNRYNPSNEELRVQGIQAKVGQP